MEVDWLGVVADDDDVGVKVEGVGEVEVVEEVERIQEVEGV